MSESYYPAHASRPAEQLLVPGPTADAPSAEMLARPMAELRASLAKKGALP